MRLSPPWQFWFSDHFHFKFNWILTGTQCMKCSWFKHWLFPFEIYMHFLSIDEHIYLEPSEPFSIFERYNLQEVILTILTQLWEGNNVLVDTAPYIDGFLLRGIRISSTLLYRPIWNKERLFSPYKSHIAGSIHLNNEHNSHRKQCARSWSFYHRSFSVERYMSFFCNSAEYTFFQHTEPVSTLTQVSCA
jgi:hypothetical protein